MRTVITSACTSGTSTLGIVGQRFRDGSGRISRLTGELATGARDPRRGAGRLATCIRKLKGYHLSLSRAKCHLHPITRIVHSTCKARTRGTTLLTTLRRTDNVRTRMGTIFPGARSGSTTKLTTIDELFITSGTVTSVRSFMSIIGVSTQPIALRKISRIVSRASALQIATRTKGTLRTNCQGFRLPRTQGN